MSPRARSFADWHGICSKTGVPRPSRIFAFRLIPSVFAPLLLAVLLCSGASLAQSIGLAPTQFHIIRAKERLYTEYPFWINRLDCEQDAKYASTGPDDTTHITKIVVNPKVSPVGSKYSLQAWVGKGIDCTTTDARSSNGSCWKVMDVIPRVSGDEYDIFPRDLLAERGDASAADICSKEVEWTITIYFLLLKGDQVLASTKWEQTLVDTRPPAPPDSIAASSGENRLYVTWNVPADQVDIDLEGYEFFCAGGELVPQSEAPAAMGGAAGASGTGGTAGTGATGEDPLVCVSDALQPGSPRPDDLVPCGEATGLTTQGASTDPVLSNGQMYAVAVASTDRVGNVGKLSSLACGTPEEVTGFFDAYKTAGGRAGRGCGIGLVRERPTPWLLGLLAACWGLFRLRQRSRRAW